MPAHSGEGRLLQQLSKEQNLATVGVLILAGAIGAYLVYALLHPEKF